MPRHNSSLQLEEVAQQILALARATNVVSLVAPTNTAVVEQDGACLYWLDGPDLWTFAK